MGFTAILNYGIKADYVSATMTFPPSIPDEYKPLMELGKDWIHIISEYIQLTNNFELTPLIYDIEEKEGWEDFTASDKIYTFEDIEEEENLLFNKFLKWYSKNFKNTNYYLFYTILY